MRTEVAALRQSQGFANRYRAKYGDTGIAFQGGMKKIWYSATCTTLSSFSFLFHFSPRIGWSATSIVFDVTAHVCFNIPKGYLKRLNS